MEKALKVNVTDSCFLTFGKDGHWLHVQSGGRFAALNMESTIDAKGGIIRSTFLAWADEQLDRVCEICRGWGSVDTPYSGSDPSCSDCDGTGETATE